jgi:hypothetical protein
MQDRVGKDGLAGVRGVIIMPQRHHRSRLLSVLGRSPATAAF